MNWEFRDDELAFINDVIRAPLGDQKRLYTALGDELEGSSQLALDALSAIRNEGFVIVPRLVFERITKTIVESVEGTQS